MLPSQLHPSAIALGTPELPAPARLHWGDHNVPARREQASASSRWLQPAPHQAGLPLCLPTSVVTNEPKIMG